MNAFVTKEHFHFRGKGFIPNINKQLSYIHPFLICSIQDLQTNVIKSFNLLFIST